jgi:peroxiredoxin
MLMRIVCFAVALLAAVMLLPLQAEPAVPKKVKPFTLATGEGKEWSLADQKEAKAYVVLFLGTECPVNNQYLPELVRLHKSYKAKGVVFVGINSNTHDSPNRILGHAQTNGLTFPVLKDAGNVVADAFEAKRTPEAFVLNTKYEIVYRGRIDDQIGIGFRKTAATRRDLAEALDDTLAGKAVRVAETEAPGCIIARTIQPKADGKVNYYKHIASILQNRCQECHRSGQVGPMPLMSFEDAVSWSEMIREVVKEGRMPPWHADPKHGKFTNDRSLPPEEREQLLSWIKDGCPKGDPKDAPPAKSWPDSTWGIGKPDVVFSMPRSFTVPADMPAAGVRYQYFVVPTNYDEDRWIQAAEARPGAREVVHHIIVYILDKDALKGGRRPRIGANAPGDGIGNGFLTSYAPGDSPLILEPGQAKKLPKGGLLLFQMHYTPDGVERVDRSSVGITFAKEKPKVEVRTRAIAQQMLFIPPNASNYKATSNSKFTEDVELLTLFPHMHVRGKAFRYVAKFPNGKEEVLLDIPRFDFNWQSNYRLAKPLKLPKGTVIHCTAYYDNSKDNLNNPDPNKWVFWGDQTWEEMMIGFADYAVPLKE